MSNKQNDSYLEELEMVQQDLKDERKSLEEAKKDYWEAARWMERREESVRQLEKRLEDLLNHD